MGVIIGRYEGVLSLLFFFNVIIEKQKLSIVSSPHVCVLWANSDDNIFCSVVERRPSLDIALCLLLLCLLLLCLLLFSSLSQKDGAHEGLTHSDNTESSTSIQHSSLGYSGEQYLHIVCIYVHALSWTCTYSTHTCGTFWHAFACLSVSVILLPEKLLIQFRGGDKLGLESFHAIYNTLIEYLWRLNFYIMITSYWAINALLHGMSYCYMVLGIVACMESKIALTQLQ